MSANVRRAASPLMLAAEVIAYLRSAVTALLAGAAVFVVSRRLAGALETPLEPFRLFVAGDLLAVLAWMAHASGRTRSRPFANVLTSLALLAIAASLSIGGTPVFALLVFWAVIVGEELWAWRGMLPARPSISPLLPGEGQVVRADLPVPPPRVAASADGNLSEESEPAEPAADVLQQLTLRATAAGQELSGWLRLPLAAGQQTGSLHVAFCPSFDQIPQVHVEAVSSPNCRIKTAQVLPHGARLDVKLEEPAEEDASVLVWFSASNDGV